MKKFYNKFVSWLFYVFFGFYLFFSLASYWTNVNIVVVLTTGVLSLLFAAIDLCNFAFNISSKYNNSFEKFFSRMLTLVLVAVAIAVIFYVPYKFYGLTQYLEDDELSNEINVLSFTSMSILFLHKAMEKRIKSNSLSF